MDTWLFSYVFGAVPRDSVLPGQTVQTREEWMNMKHGRIPLPPSPQRSVELGIGIIRISGEGCRRGRRTACIVPKAGKSVLARISRSHTIHYGLYSWIGDEVVDEVLVMLMRGTEEHSRRRIQWRLTAMAVSTP